MLLGRLHACGCCICQYSFQGLALSYLTVLLPGQCGGLCFMPLEERDTGGAGATQMLNIRRRNPTIMRPVHNLFHIWEVVVLTLISSDLVFCWWGLPIFEAIQTQILFSNFGSVLVGTNIENPPPQMSCTYGSVTFEMQIPPPSINQPHQALGLSYSHLSDCEFWHLCHFQVMIYWLTVLWAPVACASLLYLLPWRECHGNPSL